MRARIAGQESSPAFPETSWANDDVVRGSPVAAVVGLPVEVGIDIVGVVTG